MQTVRNFFHTENGTPKEPYGSLNNTEAFFLSAE